VNAISLSSAQNPCFRLELLDVILAEAMSGEPEQLIHFAQSSLTSMLIYISIQGEPAVVHDGCDLIFNEMEQRNNPIAMAMSMPLTPHSHSSNYLRYALKYSIPYTLSLFGFLVRFVVHQEREGSG
jgi:hypothetical protein